MYLSSTLSQLYRALRARGAQRSSAPVPKNVVRLGVTSLLTDVASEMVDTILPLYALYALELSPFAVGAIDGGYHAASTIARVVTSAIADRTKRLKEAAFVGYALSFVSRVVLAVFGGGGGRLVAAITVDRAGKGLRASPRDAMIALAAPPEIRASAFAVHRALDTLGSVVGPLLGFVLLTLVPLGFDVVFLASAAIALVGLVYFGLFVVPPAAFDTREAPDAATSQGSPRPRDRATAFPLLVLLGVAVGASEISPGLLFVVVRARTSIELAGVPLLQVASALTCVAVVVPLGRLADRIGALWVLLMGQLALVAAYGWILAALPGWPGAVVAAILVGAHYAASEGVLVAIASATLPRERLATGLSVLAAAGLGARIGSAVGFGALWDRAGTTTAVGAAAGIACASILAVAATLAVRARVGGSSSHP